MTSSMVGHVLGQCGNILFSSPRAKTVLIHADHKRRDAASCLLIGYYLQELGYNVVIGNRLFSRMWYYLFRPEIVVATHPDMIFRPDELAAEAKNCRFVLMHPESSGMIQKAMIAHMRGPTDDYARHYAKVLTWGPLLKEWIVEGKVYPRERVDVVGCPRYDFYRIMRRPPADLQTLGGMPSFTPISSYHKGNPFDNINAARGMAGIHYGSNGGFEDFLWASAAYVRLFLEFLDIWSLELRRDITFRPYTLESVEDYSFFRERYAPYFKVDIRSPFPQWLSERNASVFCFSSSVIESIVSGIPYITLQSVIEERLEYHQPRAELPETRGELYDFTYRPKDIAEVVEFASKAAAGTLPLRVSYEDSPRLRQLLWDYYGWPQPVPSSQLVAQAIHQVAEDSAANHSNTRWRLLRQVVTSPAKVWLFSDGGRRWKTFSDYHFMPWHLDQKPYAFDAWQRLTAGGSVQ